MTIAEKRKQIFDALTPLLKPKGFKLYKTGGDPGYVYFKDNIAITMGFNFFKSGKITFSSYEITHYEVEDYILALNKFPEVYNAKKKDHLGTVYGWGSKGSHGFEAHTPEQIDNGIALIKEYILGDGQTFLDTYTHLPNILKRMDELEKNDIAIKIWFNFFKSGKITFSNYEITHYEVEDYLLALNKFPEEYNEKKRYHLRTVYDWGSKGPHGFESDTPEQIDNGIALIKEYILGDGQTFLDTYTHLPNILKRMDELEANNILWGNRNEGGILAGTVDFLFRGLIISKLCNDSNYIHKVEKVNLLLSDGANDEWLPYYEKIKKDLKTIEPKYNLEN